MKRLAFLLLLLSLVSFGCRRSASRETEATDNSGKPPATTIEGTWVVVSSEVEGRPSPPHADHYTKMTFAGEDATLEGRTQKHELRFTLGTPTKQPKEINLYSKQEKILWKGIYEVDGNSLRLSYGQPNGECPTSLKTSRDAKAILYVLKRKGS